MATNYQHGSLGSASSNGQTICVTSWDIEDMAELADVTTTCSGGWKEEIPGLKQVTGTINGDWDLNSSPYAVLHLSPGTLIAPLVLNISNTVYYSMSAYVESFKPTVDVNDVIKWTVSFKSTGAVTRTGM